MDRALVVCFLAPVVDGIQSPVSSVGHFSAHFLLIHLYLRASCLIFAPTTLLAVNFVILGQIIKRLGPDYSRLPPKKCKHSIVFNPLPVLSDSPL